MKYKITIESREEYPEIETVYEGKNGKRYFSKYHDDIAEKGVEVEEKKYETGKMLERNHDVYVQEFEVEDLVSIIRAVNDIK